MWMVIVCCGVVFEVKFCESKCGGMEKSKATIRFKRRCLSAEDEENIVY